MDSLKAADIPLLEKQSPAPAAEPAPAPPPVRSAQVVNPLTMMKALASRPRLTAIELCLDGSSFTATALQPLIRMLERRAANHLKIFCQVDVLQRRSGRDKRKPGYEGPAGSGNENCSTAFRATRRPCH